MDIEQKLFSDAFSARISVSSDVTNRLQRVVQLARIEPGMNVLDVGTGTGSLISPLLERMQAHGHICGIDISINVLRLAMEMRFPACVRLLDADIHDLDHIDGSYHRVICHSVIHELHDRPAALANIYRMLTSGGMVVVSHLTSWERVSGIPTPWHMESEQTMPSDAQMRELLEQTGFVSIETINEPEFRLYRAKRG
ncbi:MAG: class I SAM-dependent methyltransferase [Armatimonadota bacterium]